MSGAQGLSVAQNDTANLVNNEINRETNDEAELLTTGRTGDLIALEQLLAQHERPLLRLCRGMLGHADDADDAVQETFLRALKSLHRFRGGCSFRTWLFRIAINLCLDWKSGRKYMTDWNETDHPALKTESPEDSVLGQMRITEALNTLLPRHRVVLVLKEVEGWSVAEIAEALQYSEKRVHNELYKARRTLVEWRIREAQEEQQH